MWRKAKNQVTGKERETYWTYSHFGCISFFSTLSAWTLITAFLSFLYCVSLHRGITGSLPNVNLQMLKVPNLTVPNVNLVQMPSLSPPHWIASNSDTECVSAFDCCPRHACMYLAWAGETKAKLALALPLTQTTVSDYRGLLAETVFQRTCQIIIIIFKYFRGDTTQKSFFFFFPTIHNLVGIMKHSEYINKH